MYHKKQVIKNALTRKVASANPCWRASLFVAVVAIGMAFANAAFADTNLTENVVLTEDTDWRSLGTVTIPDGVGVHLNGHKLYVAGFTGAGSIYASVIPSGYVELDYIETDGNQYINTGICPYATAKVDADIAILSETGNYIPLICASAWNMDAIDQAKCYGVWAINRKWSVLFNGVAYSSTEGVSVNKRIHLVAAWSSSARTLHIDGVSKVNNTGSVDGTSTTKTMFLPGWNSGQVRSLTAAKFRIYSFKIYKPQDTLVRDYVPVRRKSDGAVGLYDRKNGTFSPSAAETPFIEGNELGSTLGGELHIDVASGTTFCNSTVAISNAVTVVKDGLGTYESRKGQTYSGGTIVSAGRVQIDGITSSESVLHGFGAVGSDVVVASNAQVVIRGVYQTLSGYNVTIAGDGPDGNGAIYGDRRIYSSYNSPFLKSLTLSGDASIKVTVEDSFNLANGDDQINISLCGHRLTAKGSARLLARKVNVTDGGCIVSAIAPGSGISFFVNGQMSAPLADFEVAHGGALGGSPGLVVSNMTFAGTWSPSSDTVSATVLGCYSPKPTATNWPKLALGDAEHLSPTLDLSALSSTYDGTSLSFAEGATISVKLGDREIRGNSRLVSWTAEPSNIFVRGDSGVVGGLEKRSDGLYLVRNGFVIIVH